MRLFKKFLLLLATGGTTVLLSACYGTVVTDSDLTLTVTDSNTNSINNIKCTVVNWVDTVVAETNTDSNGNAILSYYLKDEERENYRLILTDPDGSNNGGDFQTEVIANPGIGARTVELTLKN